MGLRLGLLLAALSQPPQPPDIPVERFPLGNALTVLLSPDRSSPTATVDVWYHVGSQDESPGRTGLAHLLEHLTFANLRAIPGASFNAYTSTDRTAYHQTVPSQYLETVFSLESQRMRLVNLDSATLARQKHIVANERRQRIDNQPYGRAHEIILGATQQWPTIGHMSDVERVSLDEVTTFARTHYTPNNATLTVVGDFDLDVAKHLIKKHFGDVKPGPPRQRLRLEPPKLTSEKRLVFEDAVQVPRLYLWWPTAPDDRCALAVLAKILSRSSAAWLTAQESRASFVVSATPLPDQTLAQLEQTTDSIIRYHSTQELKEAKDDLVFEVVSALELPLERAEQLLEAETYGRRDCQAVTAQDVQRVAIQYVGANRVLLTVVPK